MFTRRKLAAAVLLAALVALGVSVLFASGDSLPPRYDLDDSGLIESEEAWRAIQDHYAGKLTQEQTLDILLRFWGDVPVGKESPAPAVTPVTSNWPWSSTPTPTPAPQLTGAPEITRFDVWPGQSGGRLQVGWEYPPSDLVTGFQIWYRPKGGEWRSKTAGRSSGGMSFPDERIVPGIEYEVAVRAISRTDTSEWASRTRMVATPIPTSTPVPRLLTTPTPYPSSGFGVGCDGKTLLPGHGYRAFKGSREPVSDIMITGEFFNTWVGQPGRPTPTPTGYRPWHTPTPLTFNYGFMVREVHGHALTVRATHEKRWYLELRGCDAYEPLNGAFRPGCSSSSAALLNDATTSASARSGFHGGGSSWNTVSYQFRLGTVRRVIDSGDFSEDGVVFGISKQDSNHMAFIAKGGEYSFIVNGVEVPLHLDASDRAAIEELIGEYRYASDGKWYGYYQMFGSAKTTTRERDFNGHPQYVIGQPPIGVCEPGG